MQINKVIPNETNLQHQQRQQHQQMTQQNQHKITDLIKYLEEKLNFLIKIKKSKNNNRKIFSIKDLRKKFNLNKSPKCKGYDKLITDEEKRFRNIFYFCFTLVNNIIRY